MSTALTTTRTTAPTHQQQQAQLAVEHMLTASVAAFGDVVRALLCDLQQASEGIEQFGWLGPTPQMLDHEQAYRIAVEQLAWWERFLTPLVHPRLLSEAQHPLRRQAKAERMRARLMGQQQAMVDHQAAVAAALHEPDLSAERREELLFVAEHPDQTQWWVDPQPYIERAMAHLPPLPPLIPIVAADLDPNHNFSGSRAITQLREHDILAARAQQLDHALMLQVQELFGLSQTDAMRHAHILTGMFWLALRRALAHGHHNLAASIALLSTNDEQPIREQFTRELLMSWFAYLQTITPPAAKPSLFARMRRALGLNKPPSPTHKQLTDHKQ